MISPSCQIIDGTFLTGMEGKMHNRTIIKTLSWETISNTGCFLLAYLLFGNIGECLLFTFACVGLKAIGYYWHERWWDR